MMPPRKRPQESPWFGSVLQDGIRGQTPPGTMRVGTPKRAGRIRTRALRSLARRCVAASRAHQLTERAAALTFSSVPARFPALIWPVALVGLFGQYPRTVDTMLGIVDQLGARSQAQTLKGPITSVTGRPADEP